MTTTFKERLEAALQETGATQADLARACGASAPSVWAWINKGVKPKGTNLLRAARLLRVNALWLAEGRGPMRPHTNDALPTSDEVELRDWLSGDEVELIEGYGRLLPEKQRVFMRFFRSFVAESGTAETA